MKQIRLQIYATFLLLFTFSLGAQAQQEGTYEIVGQLQDSLTGAPDAYSTLRLLPVGQQRVVAVAASDEQGHFTLKCATSGDYSLQVSGLGRQSKMLTVTLGTEKRIDLGQINTTEVSTTLGEATVVAAAPLVTSQIDRLSYSMADDPDAQGNTMIEMLRKVPLVTVDGQDNITINGKSDFKIYVNGKPNKMMSDNPSIVLKSFPASVVKKVEVITDPGAKYDAEGVSGILNIVTATEASTSGYTLTPNFRMSTKDIGGNLFAMAQTGKLTLSLNGGVHRQFGNDVAQHNEREVFADAINHRLESNGQSRNRGTFGYGGLEASYEFSAKDLLTASADMFFGNQKTTGNGTVLMSDLTDAKVYSYDSKSAQRSRFHGINTSLDYQHQFAKEDQNLTLSYRFSSNKDKDEDNTDYTNAYNVPFTLNDLRTYPEGTTQEHTAQADFTTPLGKHHTFSIGTKYIYRLNRSDNEELMRAAETDEPFVRDDTRSLLYRHRNGIVAGYTEYMFKLQKFSARAGLRLESSHIRVTYPNDALHDAFTTTLNDLIPSINFAYNLKPTMMLRANYNMRIGRPDITYLSPYVNHTTPHSISYGSPNLESEKAHNWELNFSNFTQKFSINLGLSYATSVTGLTQYAFVQDGIQHTTYGNFLHSKILGLNMFANLMLTKKTTFMVNGDVNYSDYKSYRTNDSNHGFGGRFFAMLRHEWPWKIKMNLGGGNNWARVNLQGRSESFFFYFASLSRSFLKEDRLTVEIHGFNIFHPDKTFRSTTETPSFRTSSAFTVYGIGRVGFGVSWRFGSLKAVVKKAARTIENDDVQTNQNNSSSGTATGQGGATGGAPSGMGL